MCGQAGPLEKSVPSQAVSTRTRRTLHIKFRSQVVARAEAFVCELEKHAMLRGRIRKTAADMRSVRKMHEIQRNRVIALHCTERAFKKQMLEKTTLLSRQRVRIGQLRKSRAAWRAKAISRGREIKLLQRRLHRFQHPELKTGRRY